MFVQQIFYLYSYYLSICFCSLFFFLYRTLNKPLECTIYLQIKSIVLNYYMYKCNNFVLFKYINTFITFTNEKEKEIEVKKKKKNRRFKRKMKSAIYNYIHCLTLFFCPSPNYIVINLLHRSIQNIYTLFFSIYKTKIFFVFLFFVIEKKRCFLQLHAFL